MPQESWSSNNISTGVAAMDELHQDFFEALVGLSSAPDTEFGIRYGMFVKKAEHAFSTEEQWMEDIDYPALKRHREQHARVLGALHHVHGRVMEGDIRTGRDVAEKLLPQWFFFHSTTMDMALAVELRTSGVNISPLQPKHPLSYAE